MSRSRARTCTPSPRIVTQNREAEFSNFTKFFERDRDRELAIDSPWACMAMAGYIDRARIMQICMHMLNHGQQSAAAK